MKLLSDSLKTITTVVSEVLFLPEISWNARRYVSNPRISTFSPASCYHYIRKRKQFYIYLLAIGLTNSYSNQTFPLSVSGGSMGIQEKICNQSKPSKCAFVDGNARNGNACLLHNAKLGLTIKYYFHFNV